MNLQETNRLRRLDEIVMNGGTAIANVNAGEAWVQPDNAERGFVAEVIDINNRLWRAFGPTPMIALFRVADAANMANQ